MIATSDCPYCGGRGSRYYKFNIHRRVFIECSEDTFALLPEDEDKAESMGLEWCQGDEEVCKECEGYGRLAAGSNVWESIYGMDADDRLEFMMTT